MTTKKHEHIPLAEMPIRLFGTAPDSIVDGPGLRYAVFVQGCSHRCPGCHNPQSWPAQGGTPTTIGAVLDEIRNNGLIKAVTLSGGEPFEQSESVAELAEILKDEGYDLWVYTGYLLEDLLVRCRCTLKELSRYAALGGLNPRGRSDGDCAPRNPAYGGAAAMASERPEAAADTEVADDAQAVEATEGAEATEAAATALRHPEAEPVCLNSYAVRRILAAADVLVDGPFVEDLKSYALSWRGSSNQRVIDMNASRRSGVLTEWHPTIESFAKPENW